MTELICVVCNLKDTAGADAVNGGVTFQWDEKNSLASKACPTCGSFATVDVNIFKRFAQARASTAKAKLAAPPSAAPPSGEFPDYVSVVAPDTSPASLAPARARDVVDKHIAAEHSRVLRESHKWAAHVTALRAMLRRSITLQACDLWWDGYHFYNLHSWSAELSLPITSEQYDYVVVRLINKDGSYRDITFYIDLDDEGMSEVSSITK